jgi:hypothetical protein
MFPDGEHFALGDGYPTFTCPYGTSPYNYMTLAISVVVCQPCSRYSGCPFSVA